MDNTQVPQNTIPQSPIKEPEEKSIGPAIGIIVIIALIVLGGLYFWGERLESKKVQNETLRTEETITPGADLEQMQTQSTSDESSAIEADLEATDIDNLGTEMNSIESETSVE